jgi:hypothetical protein
MVISLILSGNAVIFFLVLLEVILHQESGFKNPMILAIAFKVEDI